jgi:hypothetical protein
MNRSDFTTKKKEAEALTKEWLSLERRYLRTVGSHLCSVDITLDCGVLGELECEAWFTYYPEEPRTYDDPGCPEEFNVYQVLYNDVDIFWIMNGGEDVIKAIKESRSGDYDGD